MRERNCSLGLPSESLNSLCFEYCIRSEIREVKKVIFCHA